MTMTRTGRSTRLLVIAAVVAAAASVPSAEGAPQNGKFRTLAGVACETPPPAHCGEACAGTLLADAGFSVVGVRRWTYHRDWLGVRAQKWDGAVS